MIVWGIIIVFVVVPILVIALAAHSQNEKYKEVFGRQGKAAIKIVEASRRSM